MPRTGPCTRQEVSRVGRPLRRRAFDAIERPVGHRLEQAVQTDQFADVAVALLRLRAAVERRAEHASRRLLHRVNLPAASLGEQRRNADDGDDGAGRPRRASGGAWPGTCCGHATG